jgi:plasmid stabilization system protein ParE
MQIVVSKKALASIDEIEGYYFGIRPALGLEFKQSVAKAFKNLQVFYKYATRYDQVRVYKLPKFPYLIHFVAHEETGVLEIEQVLHQRRRSKL